MKFVYVHFWCEVCASCIDVGIHILTSYRTNMHLQVILLSIMFLDMGFGGPGCPVFLWGLCRSDNSAGLLLNCALYKFTYFCGGDGRHHHSSCTNTAVYPTNTALIWVAGMGYEKIQFTHFPGTIHKSGFAVVFSALMVIDLCTPS